MSKLDELIQKLCPDGVEYKKIEDCTLKTHNIKWKQTEGEYRYIDLSSVDRDTSSITETTVIDADNAPSRAQQIVQTDDIIFATTRPLLKRYCIIPPEYDGQIASTGFCVLRADTSIVLPRWLFFNIASGEFYRFIEPLQVEGNYPSVSNGNVRAFEVPVPPMEVQREIVRVLDHFTLLRQELSAELSARRKQYEYYRLRLLESVLNSPRVAIPDIAHTYIGLVTTMTKHYVSEGIPLIHNSDIKENRFEFKEQIYLDEPFAQDNSSRRHKKGDVITVHTGDVGTSAIIGDDLDGSLGFATIVSRIYDRGKVLPEWLSHCLNSTLCKSQIGSLIKGDRNNLNLKDFNRLVIPMPSIKEQERIVSVLNHFDELLNDIVYGLPAEIEARQKQYEYYRDKLLSFKRKEMA